MSDVRNSLDLEDIGIVYHNLDVDTLISHAITHEEAKIASSGALMIDTGVFTGRSPKDKYFVDANPSNKHISWGDVNKPISQEVYKKLRGIATTRLSGQNLYVTDVYAGSSKDSRKSIRIITEIAWQAHFVQNMFIVPTKEELENFVPEFTLYNACQATNPDFKDDNLNSEVFVAFNVEENEAVIGGTWYAGEIKKGIFSMMNYWLPLDNKMAMHCSANVGKDGDTALFFGLSGTGKTTLSTDPKRALIGDDEHGWDDDGVFNFEGGCYAKVINLDPSAEPEIFSAIRKGAILENVAYDEDDGDVLVNYDCGKKTENTRVSYPIHHIDNIQEGSIAGHPTNIIFLSADAFGILPPVSKLTKEQAMYYFLSGYTAKVAGTERGVTEPTATFSACFGEAFLPLHPTDYAKLLGEKIDEHNVNVYLVNTGWTGGAYGTGKRMSIKDTRTCINSILDGSINDSEFETTKTFKFNVPKTLGTIDSKVLNPREAWEDKDEFDNKRDELASMFIENFKKYLTEDTSFDFTSAGPQI
ncbi:MAG: phosphoenolpyruvate carboxykinase (ATP) [Campylobacterota bacterium]|nr:phosphoenolpyruvate carboxykinase (ATP) [Campylobacterota bacterium]